MFTHQVRAASRLHNQRSLTHINAQYSHTMSNFKYQKICTGYKGNAIYFFQYVRLRSALNLFDITNMYQKMLTIT